MSRAAHLDYDQGTLIVGAPKAGLTDVGAAYTYTFGGGKFQPEADLTPAGMPADARFGASVAIEKGTAVVGAPGAQQGEVHVFQRIANTWVPQHIISSPVASESVGFGVEAAISGSTIVVGATADRANGPSAGTVYSYHSDGLTWNDGLRLTVPGLVPRAKLGTEVVLDGNHALAGTSFTNVVDWAFAFEMPPITLTVQPPAASAGDLVTFATCRGVPGGLALLYAVGVNGVPLIQAVTRGFVDSNGDYDVTLTIPADPILPGNTITLRTFELAGNGIIDSSNLAYLDLL